MEIISPFETRDDFLKRRRRRSHTPKTYAKTTSAPSPTLSGGSNTWIGEGGARYTFKPYEGENKNDAMSYIRSFGFHVSTSKNVRHAPDHKDRTTPIPNDFLLAIKHIWDGASNKAKRNKNRFKQEVASPIKSVLAQFKPDSKVINIWKDLDKYKNDSTGLSVGNTLRHMGRQLATPIRVIGGKPIVSRKGGKSGFAKKSTQMNDKYFPFVAGMATGMVVGKGLDGDLNVPKGDGGGFNLLDKFKNLLDKVDLDKLKKYFGNIDLSNIDGLTAKLKGLNIGDGDIADIIKGLMGNEDLQKLALQKLAGLLPGSGGGHPSPSNPNNPVPDEPLKAGLFGDDNLLIFGGIGIILFMLFMFVLLTINRN